MVRLRISAIQPTLPRQLFRISLLVQMVWNSALLGWLVWLVFIGEPVVGTDIDAMTRHQLKAEVDQVQMALATILCGLMFTVIWPRHLLKWLNTGQLSAQKPGHLWSLRGWLLINIFIPTGIAFTLFQVWCIGASARLTKDNKAHDHTSSPE